MIANTFLVAMLLASSPDGLVLVGDDDCYVPMSRWQPRHQVRAMAEGRGWKVRRIKIDDGCYEIYFRDADGAEFEARINPATLEIIKIESESMDESHDIVPIEGDMKKSEEND